MCFNHAVSHACQSFGKFSEFLGSSWDMTLTVIPKCLSEVFNNQKSKKGTPFLDVPCLYDKTESFT